MATGIPFVAGDLATTSAFLSGQGVAELVPAGNPDAAARALHALLSDEAAQADVRPRAAPHPRSLHLGARVPVSP